MHVSYWLREINKHTETLGNSSNDLNPSKLLERGSCQFWCFSFFLFLGIFFFSPWGLFLVFFLLGLLMLSDG